MKEPGFNPDSKPRQEIENQGEKVLERLLTRIPLEAENSKIKEIQEKSSEAYLSTEYADLWNFNIEADRVLKAELDNTGVLVDLAGGMGRMKKILEDKGINVQNYIDVDITYFKTPHYDGPTLSKKTPQGIPFSLERSVEGNVINVDSDMLEFLKYVESESIDAISINGVDRNVIDSPVDYNREDDPYHYDYHLELARQIKRVLKVGGTVFGKNSVAIAVLFADKNFNIVLEDKGSSSSGILEKEQLLEEVEK